MIWYLHLRDQVLSRFWQFRDLASLKESTPSMCQGQVSCLPYSHLIQLACEGSQGSGQPLRVYKVEHVVNWKTPVRTQPGIV